MKLALILFGMVLISLAACARDNEPIETQLNQPFTLLLGQQAYLPAEDLTLTFLEVIEDSRCPSEVNCAERGQAIIAVQARLDGLTPATHHLNDNPPLKEDTSSYVKYNIQFVDLAPYPKYPDEPIPLQNYAVTLLVSPF